MSFPRVVEIMLGCWLALSPWIFGYPPDELRWWITDYAAALAVWTLASLSFSSRFERAHLGILVVAAWLMLQGWLLGPEPPPPWAQNELTLGILLAMFAILPTRILEPPEAWQRFHEERIEREG